MRIAYLIMAHTDAPQLGRLVAALSVNETTDFYILIDKKSDRGIFEKYIPEVGSFVKFIDNQVYITWGGVFSSKSISKFDKRVCGVSSKLR